MQTMKSGHFQHRCTIFENLLVELLNVDIYCPQLNGKNEGLKINYW